MSKTPAKRVKSTAPALYAVGNSDAKLRAEEDSVIAEAERILDERTRACHQGETLGDPTMAGKFCKMKLQGEEREHFGALFLDTRHRMIHWEVLFMGTVDDCEVHPREVVKTALQHNAAAVILAHNHPSGSSEPSAADRAVTARLKQALSLVDVRLLDHFVVGEGVPVSLAARGWV